MKNLTSLLLSLLFIACQPITPKPDKVEKELKEELIQITRDHIKDVTDQKVTKYVDRHVAEKTSFLSDGGQLKIYNSKKEQADSLKAAFNRGVVLKEQINKLQVQILSPQSAVVTGIISGTESIGDSIVDKFILRRTAVLVKKDGDWKEAHLHLSPLIKKEKIREE